MLEVRFLGKINIILNGSNITHKLSQKSIAILALLLVHENSINREKLIDLLWPESSEDAGKYNLRYNLWNINKIIPCDEHGNGFLNISKDTCEINHAYMCSCDVNKIHHGKLESLNQAQLEEKLSLLKGEYFENQFFPGCDRLSEYIIMERYYLEKRKLDILKRVIDGFDQENKSEEFFSLLQDYEQLDPYDESIAEKRIKFLISRGKHKEAVSYYHFFNSRLMRELGLRPPERLKLLLAESVENSQEQSQILNLKTVAMKSVEGYWIGSVLHELVKCQEFSFDEYLSDEEIGELAYLQYRLGKATPQANLVRTVDVFIHLMDMICDNGYKITIRIDRTLGIDNLSSDVIELLKKSKRKELVIEL